MRFELLIFCIFMSLVFGQQLNRKSLVATKISSGTPSKDKVLDSWEGMLLTPTTEIDIAFNGNNEFLGVYVKVENPENPQQNSIMGVRLDLNGDRIGEPFAIFPFSANASPKRYPRITFNPVANQYLVVFEYGEYSETDIMGGFISATGTVGTISALENAPKRQAAPFIIYNSVSDEYLLAYETDHDYFSIPVVAIGFKRLSSTLSVLRSGTMVSCGSSCSDSFLPVVAVNTDTGNYLTVFETRPQGSFVNDLDIWEITSSTQQYRDSISYAVPIVGTNSSSTLNEQTPKLEYSSSNHSFIVSFQAIVNRNDPVALRRNAVFVGSISSQGIFNVESVSRVLTNLGDVVNGDPEIFYSTNKNQLAVVLSTRSPSSPEDIGFALYDGTTLSLSQQVGRVNEPNEISDATPVVIQVGTTDDYIVMWIADFYERKEEQIVVTKTKVPAGVIVAAVVVPIVTLAILIIVGVAVWYKFLRIEFQHSPMGDVMDLPENEGRFDAEGKPLYAEDGRPLYDEDGNPLYDTEGNPLYDEDGYPLYDTEGNPLYDSEGNALYGDEGSFLGGQSFVKVGSDTLPREEFFKKKEDGALDLKSEN